MFWIVIQHWWMSSVWHCKAHVRCCLSFFKCLLLLLLSHFAAPSRLLFLMPCRSKSMSSPSTPVWFCAPGHLILSFSRAPAGEAFHRTPRTRWPDCDTNTCHSCRGTVKCSRNSELFLAKCVFTVSLHSDLNSEQNSQLMREVNVLKTAVTLTTQVSLWYSDFAPLNKHKKEGM